MKQPHLIAAARGLAAAAALAGIVTFYRHWAHVNPTTVALTLLLLILLLAARWGLRYAVATSIAATACYNFFFLPPVGTFTINDPQNWLALFAFLATSVIASRLSARIREEALEARARQLEVEVLYRLSRELLQTENVAELLNSAPRTIARVSNASAVLLFLAEGDKAHYSDETSLRSIETSRLQQLVRMSEVTPLPEAQAIAVPLRSGVRPRGVLILQALKLSAPTLEAIAGLMSISIDRAQALQDVTRSEAAKASEKLRSTMLDSITHELRTPLTAIKASATTLLSAPRMEQADQRDLLMVINEEADRLNHLVAQTVEMAQLDTQDVHMKLTPQPVAAIVENALQSCENVLALHEVVVDIADDLPLVDADPGWIQKVLCNLLENAAKYSAPKSPIVVVAANSGSQQMGPVAISVADRGIGIAPDERDLIFDKFYRGRARPQHVPGTGMGLAICRAIVEAHHGTMDVASEPGEGSVFSFYLPASEDQSSARRKRAAQAASVVA